jgi:CHAT domain-containing protein
MGRITDLAETIITAPSVLKAWAKARYVHLTVHGQADPADPMNTHLVLSDGNRLTVSDLLRARQPLAARLVTLAACEAAVTSGRQGIDEIVGFPAALLRAGVGQGAGAALAGR